MIMPTFRALARTVTGACARTLRVFAPLARSRDANVTLIVAVTIVPTLFGLGLTIDYARAQMLQSRINAVADAAALAATDQLYITKSWQVAAAAAKTIFTSQVAKYPSFTYNASDLVITADDSGTIYAGRLATVQWKGQSLNMFSGILNSPSFAISGISKANASAPPNINMYVMLDNSPSMLLPTTSAGISLLQSKNNNCAFSCHVGNVTYNPVKDFAGNIVLLTSTYYNNGITGTAGVYRITPGNLVFDGSGNLLGLNSNGNKIPWSGGTLTYTAVSGGTASVNVIYADPYWLGANYGLAYGSPARINMRIDDELTAAQNLITTATTTVNNLSTQGVNVTYNMQYYTFNYDAYPLTSGMTDVHKLSPSSLVPKTGTLAPFLSDNLYFPQNSDPSIALNTQDGDTAPIKSLATMNAAMATPGSGINGDKPQEILFIVTDGFQDEMVSGGKILQPWNDTAIAQCAAIKARGIQIAILYTTYDPNTVINDYPAQAAQTVNIFPQLQKCVSTNRAGLPLIYTVSTNQDISSALAALFTLAVSAPVLVQ